jgi:hypothetical protein
MMALSNLYWNIGSTKWGGNQLEQKPDNQTLNHVDENTQPGELKEVVIGL